MASDFGKFKAYKNKMYKWGYFPAIYEYDIDELMSNKGYEKNGKKIPYFLWTGRFLDWKHPELAIEVARYLKDNKIEFHMEIVGDGPQKSLVKNLYEKYELSDCVELLDFMKPEEVRERMKKADIYLFTSDRNEGWGAVANEAMNSGCVVIADSMIGAIPYLIESGENGLTYESNMLNSLLLCAKEAALKPELRDNIGRNAYSTMIDVWNPKNAAASLLDLINEKLCGENFDLAKRMPDRYAPCMRDFPKPEKRIIGELYTPDAGKLPKDFK